LHFLSVFRRLGSVTWCFTGSHFHATLARNLLVSGFALLLVTERSSGHGAYHDVVTSLSAELQRNPNDAALRYKLAEAHAEHEEWRACLKEIKLVERLAPGVYPTDFLRGLALHIAGKNEDAKTTLDGFLAADPHHVDALITRGKVLVKLGRPLDAAADFQQAVNLSPVPQPDLIADLARCHAATGNTREASQVIDAGLTAVGNDPALLRCALEIETKAAAWDAALGRIEALQKTAPRKEPWMARRAELLHQAGRTGESLAAWRALRDHLLSLPNLERGTPHNASLLAEARKSLGEVTPAKAVAPPAS
jgi:predicted Zn-dependent protease